MCLVELVTLGLPSGNQKVSDFFQIYGLIRSAWLLDGPVVQDLTWCWHVWPYWGGSEIQQNCCLLAGEAVLRAVLIVLTCLSIKPFDLGKWGEDVWCAMLWPMRNSASSSDAKGGPLSVDSDIGGPYWEMSSSRHVHIDWADLDVTLWIKGSLLKALHIIRYL